MIYLYWISEMFSRIYFVMNEDLINITVKGASCPLISKS